ncbi:MAG TPA: hypothetical protein VFN21_05060 [Acidimicrobiales bacterium]|nr:hypothetical protein [Acidimicrobiales bacterium]
MIPVVLAALVLSTSCGADVGEDGLPTHCDRRAITTIDYNSFDTDEPVPFEEAVRFQLREQAPRLAIAFPSAQGDTRSASSDRVHLLYVSDTPTGRQATLKNDNGVQMLKASASVHEGTWVVDSVELCASMTKKFGNG